MTRRTRTSGVSGTRTPTSGVSRTRTPSRDEVAALSRDEWEDLCGLLLARDRGVHRIEDPRSHTNGLNGWKLGDSGVEGYRYRWFDERLGQSQIKTLQDDVKLAANAVPAAHGAPLRSFFAVVNLDPEPGSDRDSGEDARFNAFAEWAKTEFGVSVEHIGVNTIREMLLKNPDVMPELFEEFQGSIRDPIAVLVERIEAFAKKIAHAPASEINRTLASLIQDARTHVRPGEEDTSTDGFAAAEKCLDAARQLLVETEDEDEYMADILLLLAEVCVEGGRLQRAIKESIEAVIRFSRSGDVDGAIAAHRNRGRAHVLLRDLDQAAKAFEAGLALGDGFMPQKSVELLIDICQVKRMEGDSLAAVPRLKAALERLHRETNSAASIFELSLQGFAVLGNAHLDASETASPEMGVALRREARSLFDKVLEAAIKTDAKALVIPTLCSLAKCAWRDKRFDEADNYFQATIDAAPPEFPTWAAEAHFNRALMFDERGQRAEFEKHLQHALSIFNEIGDFKSASEVRTRLAKV